MARPQFHLTGHVVHVDARGAGPVVRSSAHRVLRVAAFTLLVSGLVIVVSIVRFTMALVGSFLGNSSPAKRPGAFGRYLGDALAHLTSTHLASSGQTQITDARIRDSAGQLFPVRVEGHFVSGAITRGDLVTLGLRIIDGVNVVTDGDNHTTHEAIRLRT